MTPIEGSQQPQNQSPKMQKSTDNRERGSDKSPIIVKVLPSDAANEQAEKEKQNEFNKYFHDKLVSYSTVALAIVTSILAFFTYRLWRATVQLSKDAQETSARQANEMRQSLEIAKLSADAAQQSIIIAEKNVRTIEDTAKRQLRAYVFTTHEENMSLSATNYLSAPIKIRNFGQTPAYDMQCSITIGLERFPLDAALPLSEDLPFGSKSPIAPGVAFPQYAILPGPLTQAEIASILAGDSAIFVLGVVTYRDIFKQSQISKFCLYSTGDDFSRMELAYYHEGNEAT